MTVDVTRTVVIQAPPEHVWAVLRDVEQWSTWTASIRSVVALDGSARLVAGRRFRVRQPKLPTAVWTVVAVESTPERHGFTWANKSPGLLSEGHHTVEPAPAVDGPPGAVSTLVTLRLRQAGPLAPLLGLLSGSLTRRYVDLEAEGLKRRCETGGDGSVA